ncbi:MAG: T9SS type A sorting domain-containing protein [Phaeodactylibacter sp.]|nr:T9SS type A sorting domain-containing protein [Phaeodactylibacter sp.]
MKKLLLFSFAALLLALAANAQEPEEYCGTPPGIVPWLRDYQDNPSAFLRSNELLSVPLTIHIVGSDDGNGFYPIPRVLDAFCTLNKDFEPSNIQFFIEGEFNYIANTEYYDHDYGAGFEMMERYNVPNTINCYIVSSPAGNCGYAVYSLGIALNKGCTTAADHTWAHEIGHYLSLPHTFSGWEGTSFQDFDPTPFSINGRPVERVDGVNCQNAGDRFCDTPPDYISNRWPCRSDNTSNALLKDPTGAEFRSDGTLIMSYSFDECASRFSEGQSDAMRANLLNQRSNLLYDQSPAVYLESANVTPITPSEGAIITDANSVLLEWEPVAGADGYVVQLSLLSTLGFEIVYRSFPTTDTRVEVTSLLSDRDWLWRVRPYNRYDGCTGYSNAFAFETGNFINTTREQVAPTDFNIRPNPQRAGNDLTIEFDLPVALDLSLNLYTMAGKRIHGMQLNAHYGLNRIEVPTGHLEPGLYLIGLEHAQGRQFRKILIQ